MYLVCGLAWSSFFFIASSPTQAFNSFTRKNYIVVKVNISWFSWLGRIVFTMEYWCQTSWTSRNPIYEYQLSWNLINAYQELKFFIFEYGVSRFQSDFYLPLHSVYILYIHMFFASPFFVLLCLVECKVFLVHTSSAEFLNLIVSSTRSSSRYNTPRT